MGDYQNSNLRKRIDVMTVVLLLVGAIAGSYASWQYRNTNFINTGKGLLELDGEIYKKIIEKPYLQALFAQPSGIHAPVQESDELILLFLEKGAKPTFTFKNIPAFFETLFEAEGFNSKDRVRLREAFYVAQDVLYVISSAHEAYSRNLLDKKELNTWVAYVLDIGRNPVFLATIYEAHKYGYLDDKFAAFLRDRMRRVKEIEDTLRVIYPEMLEKDWPSRISKKQKQLWGARDAWSAFS